MLRRLLRPLVLVLVLALVFVFPVLAQTEAPPAPEPTDFGAVLNYLMTGGAAIVAAIVVSFLAERWAGWAQLSATVKAGIQALISVGLGVFAFYILTYQPQFVEQAQPVFRVIVLSLFPLIGNQLWHFSTKPTGPALPVGDHAFTQFK